MDILFRSDLYSVENNLNPKYVLYHSQETYLCIKCFTQGLKFDGFPISDIRSAALYYLCLCTYVMVISFVFFVFFFVCFFVFLFF